jgi:membrane carboxypeptidase/penicillin-binding protein
MKQALALRPELGGDSFPKPDDIETADIDPTTGLLATDVCPAHRNEYFIQGTEPKEACNGHSGDQPDVPLLPGFEWPEDKTTDLPDKAKKIMRDAERTIDDAQREVRKQIKKALDKP